MTYRPEIDTFSDAVNISDDVMAFDFEYGLNLISTADLPNRLRTRATMLLDNISGQWGEDELEGLGTIERRWGSEVLFRAVVLEHEFDKRNATVKIKLASTREAQQFAGVNLRTVVDLTPAGLLTASGVTVTPDTPLPSDISMKAGTIYSAAADDFIDDLAVFVNGYAYENHLGEMRLLQKNDDRQPTLVINADEFEIEADTAEHHKRRGWRRDAQTVSFLDITLDTTEWVKPRHEVLSGNMPGLRRTSHTDTTVTYYFDPLGVQDQVIQDNFRFYELLDGLDVEGYDPDPGDPEVPPYTAPTWINEEDETEIGFRLRRTEWNRGEPSRVLEPGQVAGRTRTQNDWTVTIRSFPTAPEEHREIVFAQENLMSEFGMLPELPWAIPEGHIQTVANRVNAAAENIPDVVKLIIPIVQQTEAQWRSLVEHRIGSVSDVTFVDSDFRVRGHYALLFVRMRWQEGRYNSIEFHLLKLREAERFPLHFESADQPIYFEDEDQPVEIQP